MASSHIDQLSRSALILSNIIFQNSTSESGNYVSRKGGYPFGKSLQRIILYLCDNTTPHDVTNTFNDILKTIKKCDDSGKEILRLIVGDVLALLKIMKQFMIFNDKNWSDKNYTNLVKELESNTDF